MLPRSLRPARSTNLGSMAKTAGGKPRVVGGSPAASRAAIIALNECEDRTEGFRDVYRSRRDTLIDGLARAGWTVPVSRASMFVWAEIPEPHRDGGYLEFAKLLLREANVAVSPGIGFGVAGDRHVRFALVENEQRIRQATRGIKRALRA